MRTIRTKKVPRNHVKAEATEKHPAQVEVYYEDVPIGYWTTVKFSGALPARRVNELLERVEKLQQAVKFAREEANGTEVTDQRVGDAVFGYLFGCRAARPLCLAASHSVLGWRLNLAADSVECCMCWMNRRSDCTHATLTG